MRHERSIEPEYFEDLYRARHDPWGFETSAYEAAKYVHTLAALPEAPGALLEVGCSIGVLTAQLARRAVRVLALDVSETALALAAKRCAAASNVAFAQMRVPRQLPPDAFDTILLSEVVYYWNSADIQRVGEWLPNAVAPNGCVLLVHWTGQTDYPKSADAAVDELWTALGGTFTVAMTERRPEYRLDRWSRAGPPA